ncbi:MAG: hypothetical protein JW969_05355 [Spirochaetales bacterium]|nr:hypothetical protein [Spirochaetales bacterium]
MKVKYFGFFLLIFLVISCSNSANKSMAGKAMQDLSKQGGGAVRKINLSDQNVQAYIKAVKKLGETSPELLEKVQAQVPVDLTESSDLIVNSGFKDLEDFNKASLVISICMSVILSAENMDKIQSKTKQDYKDEFLEDIGDEDEFDKLFREKAEEQMEETLSELEEEGLIGQNTNSVATFTRLLKEKVGEDNTRLVLKYYDDLKNVWALKF